MATPEVPSDAAGTWEELYAELADSGSGAASVAGGSDRAVTATRSHSTLPYLRLLIKSELRSYNLWKGLLIGVGCFALVTLAVLVIQLVLSPDITALVTASGLIFESGAAVFISRNTAAAKKSLTAAIAAYERAK